MVTQKSPGGSIFPYYYKGGEIHALKYGSFFKDEKALFEIIEAEADFILKPNRQLRVWVDFYETELSDKVLLKFIENIDHLQNNLIRLAIVGFSFGKKRRFNQLAKKCGMKFTMNLKFFDDPEDAKTWLVTERS